MGALPAHGCEPKDADAVTSALRDEIARLKQRLAEAESALSAAGIRHASTTTPGHDLRAMNETLERRVDERTGYVRLLHDIAEIANGSLELNSALKICMERLCRFFGWSSGHALIPDPREPDTMVDSGLWVIVSGPHPDALIKALRPLQSGSGTSLAGRVLKTGKPECMSDVRPGCGQIPPELLHLNLSSAVAFPVREGERVAAILEFFSTHPITSDGSLIELLSGVGEQLGRLVERERAHLRLLQAERLASLGTFAAGIAHEINNPLASILLTARHLRDRGRLSGDGAPLIDEIIEDADRCARIVRKVFTFARNDPAERHVLNVHDAIHAAREMIRGFARRSDVMITLDLAPQPLWLHGNQVEFEQIFLNVLRNAVQASATGQRVEVHSAAAGGEARIEVRDAGCGMDSNEMQHAFDPFFTTRLDLGATGLGLSLVHGLVGRHGGRVELASVPRGGTTVTFVFPMVEPPADVAGDLRSSGASPPAATGVGSLQ